MFSIREDPLEDLLFDLECTAQVKILELHYYFLQRQRWLVTNANELERRGLWINAVAKWSQFGVRLRREALFHLNLQLNLDDLRNVSTALIGLFREEKEVIAPDNASVDEDDFDIDDFDIDSDYLESDDEDDIPQRISDFSAMQLFTPRRTMARTMRKSTRRL